MPEILKLFEESSEEKIVSKAVKILKDGGLIAYPTETFYGLGVDAANEQAIEKIFTVKGRDFRNPIALIIGGPDDVNPLVKEVPEAAKKLMAALWPGALTIVFSASNNVSSLLTAGSGKIGLRLSAHPLARKLARKLGKPITATSANLSGAPECSEASAVITQIGHKIDAVVDGGKTPGGMPSTLVDITCDPPAILREGAVSRAIIEKHIHY
ncbi:MAG TPA: L-threonylcarbamoyladenylate synthase [Smithella sp.]|nr:L-threonylcarbamoyladenylate synthase [Smithella sp.]